MDVPQYRRIRKVLAAMVFAVMVIGTGTAAADSVSLAWDANPEPDVAGYFVYIGTRPGVYSTVVDAGPATSYTWASAQPGTTYYISVAAYLPGPVLGPRAPELITTTEGGPTLANPGNRTSTVGVPLTLALFARDPDGDPLTFRAHGLPTGLVLDPSTGRIAGVPITRGVFPVSVTVADSDAYVATQAFTWTIAAADMAPPTLAITTPTTAPSYATTHAFVTLAGTAADDVGVSAVSWANSQGGSGTAAGSSQWSVVVPLRHGSNLITVTARDVAGKSASRTLTVSASLTDASPTVRIISPTNGTGYIGARSLVPLSGTATDDQGVRQVVWRTSAGATGLATGTTSWTAQVPLVPGINLLTITARDAAGHAGSATVSVTYRPVTAVNLAADRAAPQRTGSPLTFTADARGGTAPYQFKFWIHDGTKWSRVQDWSASNTLRWTPSVPNGAYRIGVRARSAGSVAEESESPTAETALSFPIE